MKNRRVICIIAVVIAATTPHEVSALDGFFDVRTKLKTHNKQEALSKRAAMIQEIWKAPNLPATLPSRVSKNISLPNPFLDVSSVSNLSRVDQLDITMERGFVSRAYHLHPKNSNNRLVILHQGHSDGYADSGIIETIRFLVENRFSVIFLYMPMRGSNTGPVEPKGDHNAVGALVSPKLNPIKFFLEPLAVCLNYVDKNFSYQDQSLVGISGGGWTTHLYAAIDLRIKKSFAVAGSRPHFMVDRGSWGDWEQIGHLVPGSNVSNFYQDVASYLDIYVLASFGEGRRHLQILNKYDDCCFWGEEYQIYENVVRQRVAQLGQGAFEVVLDDSHRHHQISDWAREEVILKELNGEYRMAEQEHPVTNDGGLPTLSIISRVSDRDIHSGAEMLHQVALSKPSDKIVTVEYKTSDGTAKSGKDYAGASGTITFKPGATEQAFTVKIIEDKQEEGDETYTITLSKPVNASIKTVKCTATIIGEKVE